jgi:NAD(P) transhydrogenase subunit alpha
MTEMPQTLLFLFVFVLAAFVGYEVITKVPPLLHTPLMSATNAISGISLVGSLVLAGANRGTLATVLGFVAVTAATVNVVGGFLITDRMLKMFHRGRPAAPGRAGDAKGDAKGGDAKAVAGSGKPAGGGA